MDAPPAAPPVVAVVVTCDPGRWFEEALEALAAQDYPNLAILVIDAASAEDPTPRVARVVPSAYVRRLSERPGFAACANEVIGVVEGASHYLFCHDDVAPAPDAVRLLVEEAFRSNAGIVTPKLVAWDAVDRLLAVGASADKCGVEVSFVERRELDQEQHDAVRDVFVAPAGCTLVRADLFATLGGFDSVMRAGGEDVDLSWRAQVAGARVVVAPGAVVRHLEATLNELRSDAAASTEKDEREAARIRTVFKNYSSFHLLRVAPQLALISMTEVVVALAGGQGSRARAIARTWRSAFALGGLREARRALRATRAVPDHEVRELQTRGSARLRAILRGSARAEGRRGAGGLDLARAWREGLRLTVPVWACVVAVVVFGSRHLLGSRLPSFGEFAPFASVHTLLHQASSGWRLTGMGGPTPAPTAFTMLAALGTLVGGHMGFLQRVLVLGMLPVGTLGALRLSRDLGPPRARLVTAVVYLANPLAYNALANGRWSGLVTYAAFPWALFLALRTSGVEPLVPGRARRTAVIGLGLLLAATGAFVAAFVPLLIVSVVLIGGVSLFAGGALRIFRAAGVAILAALVAALLLFPWAIGFLPPGNEWASFIRPTPTSHAALGVPALLRFQTGPNGAGPLGWALLVTAALPLIVGREWRWTWAVRFWGLALASWGLTWVGTRGWLPFALPPAEVTLVPGALGLAMCAGLGLAAFDIDLRGYHFGWRQLVSTIAAAAAVVAVLPVVGAAVNGRWHLPAHGAESVLSWMPDRRSDGDFRVLWLGDPDVMPLSGWELRPGLAYATTRNGLPDVSSSWPGSSRGATRLLAQAVSLAENVRTTQVGHLLAPMAVRYIVVVARNAPSDQPGLDRPPPGTLVAGLQSQVDLRHIDSDPAYAVYENAAWYPSRAQVPPTATAAVASDDPASARSVTLSGATPVLGNSHGPTSFSGPVTAGEVLISEAPSPRWRLRVAGSNAARTSAFGLANAFVVTGDGNGSLTYRTPPVRVLALAAQVVLWLLAVVYLWVRRREARGWTRRTLLGGSEDHRASDVAGPAPAVPVGFP